jgi:ribosomal protein L14E/L6E/L27E
VQGRLVISKKGRDTGRAFIILQMLSEEYALIADGALRTAERPKKKKIKHLAPKPALIPLWPGMSDSDIRKAIRAAMPDDARTE